MAQVPTTNLSTLSFYTGGMQMLNLTHDWLRSFLPHVLTKVDRVSFGLLTPEDLQRALKVLFMIRLQMK